MSTKTMSKLPKSQFAKSLVRNYRLAKQFLYDFSRFRKHSSSVKNGDTKEKLQALVTMAYHSIEKGLSLEHPRPGFGKRPLTILQERLTKYVAAYGHDEHTSVSINALQKYIAFNKSHGIDSSKLEAFIGQLQNNPIGKSCESFKAGGVKQMTRLDFLNKAKMNLEDFFNVRSSVRQYSEKDVSIDQIRKAINMAQKTPCVCNRQSWKVHCFQKPDNVSDALKIQGGAAGFDHRVKAVLVISSDLAYFQSPGERYQCWIDGGLFAMSLIYALHSLGLVTCCLNWSKEKNVDQAFKKRFSISESHSIIMLLSVGHPKENFSVAESWRKPIETILTADSQTQSEAS